VDKPTISTLFLIRNCGETTSFQQTIGSSHDLIALKLVEKTSMPYGRK